MRRATAGAHGVPKSRTCPRRGEVDRWTAEIAGRPARKIEGGDDDNELCMFRKLLSLRQSYAVADEELVPM